MITDEELETEKQRRALMKGHGMMPHQRSIFEMYVALGDERSLQKLLNQCQEQKIDISMWELKRWSSDFGWADLALRTDMEIARSLAKQMLPEHTMSTKMRLQAIQRLEEKFYKMVENDEIKMDFERWVSLLGLKDRAMGVPGESIEHTHTHKFTFELNDEQLKTQMRLQSLNKHGLPRIVDGAVVDDN